MFPPRVMPFAAALLIGACATSELVPESEPAPQVATIESDRTIIENIDERYVRIDGAGAASARFELPPGRHMIEISLKTDGPASDGAGPLTITVCFSALPGLTYQTRAVFAEGRWHPEIVDEGTGEAVQRSCDEAPAAAQAPAAVQAPAAAPKTAIAAETKPATAPTATAPTPPPAAAVGTTVVPQPTPSPASLPVPVTRPRRYENLPGTGLSADVGFFFGGDSLYDVRFDNAPDRHLSAGRGVHLSLGGLWTPLWADDQVGFGVGGRIGWKYDSVEASNGSASLWQLPVSVTAHAVIPFHQRWFALLRGGLEKDLAGHLSGHFHNEVFNDPGTDANLDSTLGLTGEAGLYCRFDRVAVGAGLRYSTAHAWYQGSKYDASSFGVVGSGQYTF